MYLLDYANNELNIEENNSKHDNFITSSKKIMPTTNKNEQKINETPNPSMFKMSIQFHFYFYVHDIYHRYDF